MERKVFLVVLLLLVLPGALALDAETLIGFVGDIQNRVNFFGDIETAFEGIFDVNAPLISFVFPTRADGNVTSDTNIEINVSIEDVNLDEVKYSWDGMNFTLYNDSLVLMYNFDNVSVLGESDSLVKDVSRGGNDGTVYGASWNSSGRHGGAFEFDGTNDRIDLGSDLGITGELTVSSWVKPKQAPTGLGRLIATTYDWNSDVSLLRGWSLGNNFGSTDSIYFILYNESGASGGYAGVTYNNFFAENLNNWTYVTGVYKPSQYVRLYINGVMVGEDTSSVPANIAYGGVFNLRIGSRADTTSQGMWDGTMDEMRISNRALSSAEISQMYMSNLNKYDTSKWLLYVNQTENATDVLGSGLYTYQAFAEDNLGNANATEVRSVRVNFPPVISSAVLNSTLGTNLTSENLSVSFAGVSDADGDAVTNITDWRKDGASVAILNMPFDSSLDSVAKDYSTFGNDGTLSGPTWTSSGKIGGGYEFDGVDDVITIGNIGSPQQFSVSFWVNPYELNIDAGNNYRRIVTSSVSTNFILIEQAGGVSFRVPGVSVVNYAAGSVSTNSWSFVTVVYDQSDRIVYVDGIERGRNNIGAGTVDFGTLNLVSTGQAFNGSLDEVQIYNHSLSPEQIAANYQAGLANHSVEMMVSNETSKGDVWSVAVTPNDGYWDGSMVLSNNLTIGNDLPTVTLTSPNDWNASTDRSPNLTWSGYDADGDALTYEIAINEHKYSGAKICNDDISDDTLTVESYVPSSDLLCLYDNGYYYNWSVRAHDGTGWGEWSSVWHFNLTAEISINLASSEVAFGSMNPGDSMNTSDDDPTPFEIDNDGNVVTNISLNSSALWEEATNDSSYYQFKADNTTAELGAFNWLISVVDWFNMPITGEVVGIGELNYVDGDDSAEVDIRLEVPENEGPGVKNATILFTGVLAE